MATVVEELVVKLTGDASGLERSIGRASSLLKGFLTVEAARRIAMYGVETARWADSLSELSQTLGVTTDKLQQLHYAAVANGGSVERLDTAMIKFTQVLGDAYLQGGPLVDTMREFNIRSVDMNGNLLSTADILPQVADAIANAKTQQEALSIATDFFGRSAAPEMVRVLGQGSSGLAELEGRAKDAGAVMREDLVAAAAEVNDKFDLLALTMGTSLKSAFIETISLSVGLKNEFVSTIEKAVEAVNVLANVGGQAETSVNQSLIRETEQFRMMRDRFWRSRNAAGGEGETSGPSPIGGVAPRTGVFMPNRATPSTSGGSAMASAPEAIRKVTEESGKAGEAVGALNRKLDKQVDIMGDLKDETTNTFRSFAMAIGQGENALDALRRTALNVISDIGQSLLNSAFGGSSGGGIGGTIASAILGSFGGGKMKSYAVGTSYVPNDMIANIHKGEMIIPKQQADQIRNGGMNGVNQTINVSVGVQQTVRAEIMRMLPQLKGVAVAGVADANRRTVGAF